MIQSTSRFGFRNYETVTADYHKSPHKPTLDGEVAYEYSLPLHRQERERRPGERIAPWDVRRAAYWSVFSGACGFTYGHRNLIGWVRQGEQPLQWGADQTWFQSLDAPGAQQMKHLRALIESRPLAGRVPDQSLVVPPRGDGFSHVRAMRAQDGSYAMVYVPTGAPVTINFENLPANRIAAHWFDPRTGKFSLIEKFPRPNRRDFKPSTQGRGQDWVLVLDAVSSR